MIQGRAAGQGTGCWAHLPDLSQGFCTREMYAARKLGVYTTDYRKIYMYMYIYRDDHRVKYDIMKNQ